jgi:hypothetical protein
MPIPQFNEAGLLPPGVHDCTLDEVRVRLGVFQTSDRRPRLFAALQQLVDEIRSAGTFRAMLINGSFVTSKPAPNDIDLILVLPAAHNFRADLSPNEYNLVSARAIRRRFGFDALVVLEGKEDYTAALELFQQVRDDPGTKKGLLRLNL